MADDGNSDFLAFNDVNEHVAAGGPAGGRGRNGQGIIELDIFGKGRQCRGVGCGEGLQRGHGVGCKGIGARRGRGQWLNFGNLAVGLGDKFFGLDRRLGSRLHHPRAA